MPLITGTGLGEHVEQRLEPPQRRHPAPPRCVGVKLHDASGSGDLRRFRRRYGSKRRRGDVSSPLCGPGRFLRRWRDGLSGCEHVCPPCVCDNEAALSGLTPARCLLTLSRRLAPRVHHEPTTAYPDRRHASRGGSPSLERTGTDGARAAEPGRGPSGRGSPSPVWCVGATAAGAFDQPLTRRDRRS